MWSRRAQEYDQKINSGKIYELAEVVKDLNKKFSALWPNISKKKDPMPDHEKFKEIKNKYDKHFSEKPGND